jgi:hypothetical protein
MDDMGAIAQIEIFIHASPEARLPLFSRRCSSIANQHVMIEMARIAILARPIFS